MDVSDAVIDVVSMPDKRYAGLWDAIIVNPEIKDRLLWSAVLALRLRSAVPFEVAALHGLILLYGPPGTGKTTLARGLAHKLASFTATRKARLIEVDPHGLMSAEHGQSQQKIMELLTKYVPSLADDGTPTVVLLDEVESMAVARSEASLAANPADVHRATDAVLSALDHNTSDFPHLVFVATSNFTKALDAAFLSRADTAILVPPPDADGALAILRASLMGLSTAFLPLAELADSPKLAKVAKVLAGKDGRRIRKTVTEAMLGRIETVVDPGTLAIDDLLAGAHRVLRDQISDNGMIGGTGESAQGNRRRSRAKRG